MNSVGDFYELMNLWKSLFSSFPITAVFVNVERHWDMRIYIVKNIDDLDDSLITTCACFFPEWRKQQMMAYKFHRGRIQNAVAYLLLVKALKDEGVFDELPEFFYNEDKKPFLKNYTGWFFNVSHCKSAVCCVLSNNPVGIDIEEIREYKDSLANYVCNEAELQQLSVSETKADDFYKLWTQKEAVFKLIGTGITHEIKNILNTDNAIVTSEKIDNMWLTVATL